MAAKVINVECPKTIPYIGKKAPYTASDNFEFFLECNIRGEYGKIHCRVFKGHQINGASIPFPVNLLPGFGNWYGGTDKDIPGSIHDDLYGASGVIEGLPFSLTPDEADDIYRGSKRCTGDTRFQASCQDFFLVFAHTKRHWGNYMYEGKDQRKTVKLTWEPMR